MTEKKIVSDFALFNDILEDIATKEREEEEFFHVSPKIRKSQNEEKLHSDLETVKVQKSSGSNLTNERKESVSSQSGDDSEELHNEEKSTTPDSNRTFLIEENEENNEAPGDMKDDTDSENEIQANSTSSELESGEQNEIQANSTSSESENNEQQGQTPTEKDGKMVSFTLQYDNFCSILNKLEKENGIHGKSMSFDIDAVAGKNKMIISNKKNHKKRKSINKTKKSDKLNSPLCKCCKNSLYNKSSFPELKDIFRDDYGDIHYAKPSKPQSVASSKKTKPKKIDLEFNCNRENNKHKLDSNLKDSGNPVLLSWLNKKNKLEKQKRRQGTREKKRQRKHEKQNLLESSLKSEESEEKLQEWIDRKKKELREEKSRISPFVNIEEQEPNHNVRQYQKHKINSNNMNGKQASGASTQYLNDQLGNYDDNESRNKVRFTVNSKRPLTSPAKRHKGRSVIAFNDFREKYLYHPECPRGYSSIRSFTNSIVREAIEEIERGSRIKEARLRRPKTASVVSALNHHTGLGKQMRILNHQLKPKTFKEWLAEKKEQDKEKTKERLTNKYYEKLEHEIILEERERRRTEASVSKKRVYSAPVRKNKVTVPDVSTRLEPQGSENVLNVSK